MARQAKTPKTVNDVLRSPAKRESGSQASGPGGTRTHTSFEGLRILSPLRLPFRHGADEADSTGDAASLESIRRFDENALRPTLLGALPGACLSESPFLGWRP